MKHRKTLGVELVDINGRVIDTQHATFELDDESWTVENIDDITFREINPIDDGPDTIYITAARVGEIMGWTTHIKPSLVCDTKTHVQPRFTPGMLRTMLS